MHITALLSFYRCIYNVPCYHFGKSLKAHLCSWYTNHSVPYLHSCEHTVFLPHNCDKSKLKTSKEIKLRYWFLWLNILHLSSLLHRPLSSAIDIIFKTSRSVILTLLFPQYKSEASQLQSSVLHLYKGIIRITVYSNNLQYLFLLFRKQTNTVWWTLVIWPSSGSIFKCPKWMREAKSNESTLPSIHRDSIQQCKVAIKPSQVSISE